MFMFVLYDTVTPAGWGILFPKQLFTLGNELIWYQNSPQWASSTLENNSPSQSNPVSGNQWNVQKEILRKWEHQDRRMTATIWQVLHSEQHSNFWWPLSDTHEHTFLLILQALISVRQYSYTVYLAFKAAKHIHMKFVTTNIITKYWCLAQVY